MIFKGHNSTSKFNDLYLSGPVHPCTSPRGSWTSTNPTLRTASYDTWPTATLKTWSYRSWGGITTSHNHIFLKLSHQPEGDQSSRQPQNQKLCSISPSKKNEKLPTSSQPSFFPAPSTSANIRADKDSNHLEDDDSVIEQTGSDDSKSAIPSASRSRSTKIHTWHQSQIS